MDERRSVLKSTLVTSAITILSRIVGLIREQVRGYYIGTGMESDAFGIASTIPNMMRRLFAEGAMTAAFVPVFSGLRADADRERLSRFYSSFMTLFLILMAAVTGLGILLAGPLVENVFSGRFDEIPGKVELTVGLTQAMFPYLFLVSIAAIVQAVLNSFKVFGPSAFTPILMSGANIAVVVLFSDRFENAAWALAVGFVIGGALQTLFQLPYLHRRGIRFRPTFAGFRDPAVRAVGRAFVPGIFSAGVYQINVTVSQVIATSLDEGSVAALQYSLRMQELVLGVFAVSLATVTLPTLSEQVHDGDMDSLKKTLGFSMGLLAFVTLPAVAGLIVLAEPVIRLLFERGRFDAASTDLTVFALYFHVAGVLFIGLQRNVVQVFYALRDTRTPSIVAGIVMVVHVGLCYLLAIPLKHGGIAAAGSLAALLNWAILHGLLRRRIGRLGTRKLASSFFRTGIASAAMTAVILPPVLLGAFDGVHGWRLALRLLPLIGVGGAVFLGVAWVVRCPELADFLRMVRRKVGGA